MKIGILTHQYINNYGAFLQAWALRSVFKSKPIHYGITDEIPRFLTKSHRTLKIA